MKHQFLDVSVNLLVESTGIEPVTSCLQGRRSPSWANPPYRRTEIHIFRLEIFSFKTPLCLCFSSPNQTRFTGLWFGSMRIWKWWAKMDSNHRPHDYQSCALASWAIGPYLASTSSLGTSSSVPSKLNNASSHYSLTLVLTLGRY